MKDNIILYNKKCIAYNNFLEEHNFKKNSIRKCFLLPTEEDEVIDIGFISMNF